MTTLCAKRTSAPRADEVLKVLKTGSRAAVIEKHARGVKGLGGRAEKKTASVCAGLLDTSIELFIGRWPT